MVRTGLTVAGVSVCVMLIGIAGYFLPNHPSDPEPMIQPSIVELTHPHHFQRPMREMPAPPEGGVEVTFTGSIVPIYT